MDRREALIIAFALRYLVANLWPAVEREALDNYLNEQEQPSLIGDEEDSGELEEMAARYEKEGELR